MQKLRKGDSVKVIAGKDKGKQGVVLRVLPREILVEGINMVKRHTKPSKTNEAGGIISREKPLAISNVMLVDSTGKPSRVGIRQLENGSRERFYKSSGEAVKVLKQKKKKGAK